MTNLTTRNDYKLIGVFGAVSAKLRAEVCELWERNGVIGDPTERNSRASQLVCIARNKDGGLAGVATAYQQSMTRNRENSEVFIYRTFIQPGDRKPLLFNSLFFAACQVLENAAVDGVPDSVVFIAENSKFLRPNVMDRIFARNGCHPIGKDPRGLPIWAYPLHQGGPHKNAVVLNE